MTPQNRWWEDPEKAKRVRDVLDSCSPNILSDSNTSKSEMKASSAFHVFHRIFQFRPIRAENGYTVSLASVYDPDEWLLFVGASACSPEDVFSAKLGAEKAYGRARQSLYHYYRGKRNYDQTQDPKHEYPDRNLLGCSSRIVVPRSKALKAEYARGEE